METDSVNWIYEYDNTDSTLTETTAYLYALCGKYAVQAIPLVTGGGSSSGGTTPQIIKSPIPITGQILQQALHGTEQTQMVLQYVLLIHFKFSGTIFKDFYKKVRNGTERVAVSILQPVGLMQQLILIIHFMFI